MPKIMLVNALDAEEVRVAVLTDGVLDETVAEQSFDKDATASDEVNLPDATHAMALGFEQAYDAVNADGIAYRVAKASEADRNFRIITPLEIREEAGVSVATPTTLGLCSSPGAASRQSPSAATSP